jgi:hypothetical protein
MGSVFLGFTMLESAGSFSHSQPSPEASWRVTLEALHAMLCSLGK